MIPIGLGFLITLTICGYYYTTADKYNRSKLKYGLLGFLLPILPFIIFLLFIAISHLILGHDPKGRIGKGFFTYGMITYIGFVLLLPQYLKYRWKKEEPIKRVDNDILD